MAKRLSGQGAADGGKTEHSLLSDRSPLAFHGLFCSVSEVGRTHYCDNTHELKKLRFQSKQATYYVTMRCVRVTILAVEKQ